MQNECLSIKSRIEALDGDRQSLIIIIIKCLNVGDIVCRKLGPVLDISRIVLYTSMLRDSYLDHLRDAFSHYFSRGKQNRHIDYLQPRTELDDPTALFH